jgi:hypothetical protein
MPSTYDKIATYTIPSTTSSFTFSSIPSTYDDLVLVGSTGGSGDVSVRFNADSSNNYSQTQLWGNAGAVVYTQRSGALSYLTWLPQSATVGRTSGMLNIFNYANNSLKKSMLALSQTNDYQRIYSFTNTYQSTTTISSILILAGTNIATNSTFTLYGIKRA